MKYALSWGSGKAAGDVYGVWNRRVLALGSGLALAACAGRVTQRTADEGELKCVDGGRCSRGTSKSAPVVDAGNTGLGEPSPVVDAASTKPPEQPPAVDAGSTKPRKQPPAVDAGSAKVDAGSTAPGGQPLAEPVTLQGVVTLADGFTVPPGDVRVAMMWRGGLDSDSDADPACGGEYSRSMLPTFEAFPGSVTVPGRFSLTLTRTPALAAFNSLLDGNFVAEGGVVVYLDGNHNGVLDRAPVSGSSPDRVLGTSSLLDADPNLLGTPSGDTYRITYSSKYLGNYGPPYVAGYGIMHWHHGSDGATDDGQNLPLSSDIHVVLEATQRVDKLVCETICFPARAPLDCPKSITALPAGGQGQCWPRTNEFFASYQWTITNCEGCSCKAFECDYPLDPTEPAPAGWPCGGVDRGGADGG